jgi:hypothetical protein
MVSIDGFDPLSENLRDGAPQRGVIQDATRRVVLNILKSYTSYYDAFSEMIQNALDALDEAQRIDPNRTSNLWITIDIGKQQISVVDNGVGMDLDQFKLCFRPSVSFKKRREYRGHKGVGATFLAYGFSSIRLQTIRPSLAIGAILRQGREWAEDIGYTIERPTLEACDVNIKELQNEQSGTSVELQISDGQRPQLAWLQASKPQQWLDVLRVKTPLGGIYLAGSMARKLNFKCHLKVVALDGSQDSLTIDNPEYLYPHEIDLLHKVQDIDSIEQKLNSISGDPDLKMQKLPDEFRRLDAFYKIWDKEALLADPILMRNVANDEEQRTLIERHDLTIYGCFMSTAKTWTELKEKLGIRRNADFLKGGLQLASDFMAQGDLAVIPLTSTIGYQNNTHVIVHLTDGNPDMGRKVFQPEIKLLAEELSRRVVDVFKRYLKLKKEDTGASLQGESDDLWHWQQNQIAYRTQNPFQLIHGDQAASILSAPQSEQDVISLFHELLGMGVLRGYGVYATSESTKYDSLFLLKYKTSDQYSQGNQLGISESSSFGKESKPYVLEYKLLFDALVRDLEREEKYENDISLVVVWRLGEDPREKFVLRSYLVGDEGSTRQFFGATHAAFRGSVKAFEIICLADLIQFLAQPDLVIARHKAAMAMA